MRVAINVPDDLYSEVKASGINMGETCRQALREAVTLSHTEEEGLEIMEALYKWLKVGRKQLNQLQDFLT